MANEKRLIDADALMDSFRRYIAERHDRERCVSEENCNTCERECLWRRVVKNAPAVDAVEVVRCKDCKWWQTSGCWYHQPGKCVDRDPSDFCSDGERRIDV